MCTYMHGLHIKEADTLIGVLITIPIFVINIYKMNLHFYSVYVSKFLSFICTF